MTEPQPARYTPCESENRKTFMAEMIIRFPGIEGLNKPIVWLYPSISVCLECGRAQFVVPEKESEVLRTGGPEAKKPSKSDRRKAAAHRTRQRRA
jgi:hypothetical protein